MSDKSSVIQWWENSDEKDRKDFLTEIGIHAYFISPMRQCCIDNMNRMLIDLSEIFNGNNLHYWLDFGGLLGIIRTGELIPYDKDIDIGIFEEDIDKYNSLEKQITDKGYRFYKIEREKLSSDKDFVPRIHLGLEKTHCTHICACDIFIWQNIKKRDPRKSIMINEYQFCCCNSSYFENAQFIEWKGAKIKVPQNPEEYLKLRYGPKWKLADPLYYQHNVIGSDVS